MRRGANAVGVLTDPQDIEEALADLEPEPPSSGHSPIPPDPQEDPRSALDVDWPVAQRLIIEGQRVTRRAWQDSTICIFLHDGRLTLRKPRTAEGGLPRAIDGDNMGLHDLIVTDGDMYATDWTVVAS